MYASTPLNDETKQKLGELGDVKYCVFFTDQLQGLLTGCRYIVAGNTVHWMYVKEYKDAYPSATTIGPEELNVKLKGWKLDKGGDSATRRILQRF